MLNEKAIFEVGNIIRVRTNWNFKKLSAEEIIKSVEYQKEFKTKYPELCKLIEGEEENKPTEEDIVGCSATELGEI